MPNYEDTAITIDIDLPERQPYIYMTMARLFRRIYKYIKLIHQNICEIDIDGIKAINTRKGIHIVFPIRQWLINNLDKQLLIFSLQAVMNDDKRRVIYNIIRYATTKKHNIKMNILWDMKVERINDQLIIHEYSENKLLSNYIKKIVKVSMEW